MSSSTTGLVRVEELGQKQETALAALRGGSSFPQAAEAAGVGRATVYRWMQSDPHFRAAYNAWQQEQAESARARLLKLADQAVDVVEKALARGDQKIAVGVLKNIGAMRRPERGATDPEVLKLQMDLQRERDKYKACEGMVQHLLTQAGLTPAQQRQYIREQGMSTLAKQLPSPQKLLSDARLATAQEAEDETSHEYLQGLLEQLDESIDETLDETGEGSGSKRSADPGAPGFGVQGSAADETAHETLSETPAPASHSSDDAANA